MITMTATEYRNLPVRSLYEGGDIRLIVSEGYVFVPDTFDFNIHEGSVVAIVRIEATDKNETGLWCNFIPVTIRNKQDDRVII